MRLTISALLIAVLTVGCNKTTTPTDTTPAAFAASDVFTGTLSPNSSQMRAFNVTQSSTTTVTLVSLISGGVPVTGSVSLLLGTPNSDASCQGVNTVSVSPALTAQISQSLNVGSYCFLLTDAGTLTGDASFAVRISETSNPTPLGSAGTDVFTSNVYPGGTSTRTFPASVGGQISVKLTQLSPAVPVRFSLGVPNGGTDCQPFKIVTTTPGVTPELSASADAGAYCVRIADLGQVTQRTQFEVQITHP